MFTEEEAKEKWCPFAGGERITRQTEDCIASSCMAWRWSEGDYTDEKIYRADGTYRYKQKDPDKGYCGLAGRP